MPRECPYCGQPVTPEEIRFVATHPSLTGDPVLGTPWPVRFLPVEFTREGLAVDPMGSPSDRPACPHCRCEFPRVFLDTDRPLAMHLVQANESIDMALRSMSVAIERLARAHITLRDVSPDDQPTNSTPLRRTLWLQVETGDHAAMLVLCVDDTTTTSAMSCSGVDDLVVAARRAIGQLDARA